jgi:hypothetical protein
MMNLNNKLGALDRINRVYDEYVAGLDLACRKYCCHCCTSHATMTTLEAFQIFRYLQSIGGDEMLARLPTHADPNRFRPDYTTNRLALLCAEDLEPPQENYPSTKRPCPLLTDDLCPIYPVRPFGCRCLISQRDCGNTGVADVEEFTLSINTVFLQTIEHLDAGGCSGNFFDVMNAMSSEEHRRAYEAGKLRCAEIGLTPNQPLRVLMVPPEHRVAMEPILQALRRIKV